jgi:hypothetical protein
MLRMSSSKYCMTKGERKAGSGKITSQASQGRCNFDGDNGRGGFVQAKTIVSSDDEKG